MMLTLILNIYLQFEKVFKSLEENLKLDQMMECFLVKHVKYYILFKLYKGLRICNLIECYIFRFIVVYIFIVGMGFPMVLKIINFNK